MGDLLSKYAAQVSISGYRILGRFAVFFIALALPIMTPLDRLVGPFWSCVCGGDFSIINPHYTTQLSNPKPNNIAISLSLWKIMIL